MFCKYDMRDGNIFIRNRSAGIYAELKLSKELWITVNKINILIKGVTQGKLGLYMINKTDISR